MDNCRKCGHYDPDFGCACPSLDKWFSCPIESELPENKKLLLEYIDWYESKEK